MTGWCPRCDAVRAADGACPECGTPLVSVERRPKRRPDPAEPVVEVGAVAEGPAGARLRVALVVAAVVLTALAFVAGHSIGHQAPRAAPATVPTTTTEPAAQPSAQRTLGWPARPARGITFTAVSLRRIASGDPSGDDVGQLTIRIQGLPAGRRLLGLQGLELLDLGGGVFASPDEHPVAGQPAALVQPTGQGDTYVVDLGPTPDVDTLAQIKLQSLLLSQPPSGRNRIELDSGGSWPAKPPLRAIEPAADTVSIDVGALNLRVPAGGYIDHLPFQIAGAFVGGGRAVVALRSGSVSGAAPDDVPRLLSESTGGAFPVSARLLAGNRVVCERTAMFGPAPDASPLVVLDCPTAPAAHLAVELGAGAQPIALRAALPA
jgi:hypothetical protein